MQNQLVYIYTALFNFITDQDYTIHHEFTALKSVLLEVGQEDIPALPARAGLFKSHERHAAMNRLRNKIPQRMWDDYLKYQYQNIGAVAIESID